MYSFALYAYTFHNDMFFNSDLQETFCSTLFQCLISAIHKVVFNYEIKINNIKGVRSTGGYGDIMTKESIQKSNLPRFYSRYIADMLFWALVNIIFLNIIFGIIIDKFAGFY